MQEHLEFRERFIPSRVTLYFPGRMVMLFELVLSIVFLFKIVSFRFYIYSWCTDHKIVVYDAHCTAER